jgi:hypothetical protein
MTGTSSLRALAAFVAVSLLVACGPTQPPQSSESTASPAAETAVTAPEDAAVVEITALDYAFQAPEEIPSGWVTFRMRNAGRMEHFALLTGLPEGITFEDHMESVVPVFDRVWYRLRDGEIDKAQAGQELGSLPEWYLTSARQAGGPGFLAAGLTGETTVFLEPGTYVMECYVKTIDGEFHTALGMIRPITVTAADSGAGPPEADIHIRLSNYALEVSGDVTAGEHTVAVHFDEHPEFGLGNDVHLARLTDDAELDALIEWLDWMNVDGLVPPAPAVFLGGAHEMPVGSISYFTVSLEPGRYAWIAESSAHLGAVAEFTVE